MLLRFTLGAAGALVLAGTAAAQLPSLQAQPVTSQVKDGGIYHMSTGTWTRGLSASALAGPEVIYDNTCSMPFYFGHSTLGDVYDSGRVPSISSPTSSSSLPGTYDLYEVNGFQVGYCTFEPSTTSFDMSFVDCYAACDTAGALPTPLVVFNIVNAPGGTASGGQGCWLVGFDLANTTFTFNLGGDCNGTYNNTPSTDSFGWAWTQSIPTTGSAAGMLFAGHDPMGFFPTSAGGVCGGIGGGTTFAGAAAGPGSGMGQLDQMEIGGGALSPGCYWFGGYSPVNPHTSFHLTLQGDLGVPSGPSNGASYCAGDGTGAACPCGNTGAAGNGCDNSAALGGANMVATGSASFGADTFGLNVVGVPGAKPGLLLRANNQANGGLGVAVGDGLICAVGGSQRSQVQITDAAGVTSFTNWMGAGFGSVANMGAATNFQFWYRDPMGGPCATGFNFTNAWTVTYMP
jgi:hypothetical protein